MHEPVGYADWKISFSNDIETLNPRMIARKILAICQIKTQAAWILVPSLLGMLVFWAIARFLFGVEGEWYVIERHPISSQGNAKSNPIGVWFFMFGTAFGSFGIALLMLLVHQRLGSRLKWLSNLFVLLGILGALGFLLVGMTPQGSPQPIMRLHSLGEGLAFLGLGGAAFISFVVAILRILNGERWPTTVQFLALSGLVIQLGSMVFFAESSSLRQWSAFNALLVWLVGLFIITPERIENQT